MRRRSQLIPWQTAGRVSDGLSTGDDVVRETGWVFNNAIGDHLTLEEFVKSGDDEVTPYLNIFGLRGEAAESATFVEVGSGIGRMTCAFTREFGEVVACDVDQGFLERCYETVGKFGVVEHLRTSLVADGRTLDLPPNSADVVFSYITLQHCSDDDALDLAQEAVRVTRPGGKIALNFRAPSGADRVIVPLGAAVRALYQVPIIGKWAARRRPLTRLAWSVSRLSPDQVTAQLRHDLCDIEVWSKPGSKLVAVDGERREFEGINANHWWLTATVR